MVHKEMSVSIRSTERRKKLHSIIDKLDDKDLPAALKATEYFHDPLQEFVDNVVDILKISSDLEGVIKKYLRDEKWEEFIYTQFGDDYNPYKMKEKLIHEINMNWWMGEDQKNPLLTVLPDSVLNIIKVPDFMISTDSGYENIMETINMDRDLIKNLYKIVKKWPEFKD